MTKTKSLYYTEFISYSGEGSHLSTVDEVEILHLTFRENPAHKVIFEQFASW